MLSSPLSTSHPSHIALIGPAYPYRGGIAHFLEGLYRGLEARGHDVTVVTFTLQYPPVLFPGKTQFEDTAGAAPVPAERLLSSIGPLSWRKTARHLQALRPDAAVFMHWMPFFAPAFGTVARAIRRRGITPLAVVHNALPHEPRFGDVGLSRYFLNACRGLVVMSEAVERDLERMAIETPRRRVPHPVYAQFGEPMPQPDARARLGLPLEAPVLLFFGFVREYKGLHVLLDAMPHVIRELPQVRLVVAGEFYDDEAPYRALIQRHGLDEHVVLRSDYIPTDEVPVYFSAADVVVQPYVSATQSGVAQIAYHFEKPLIITDVGGLAEMVPHEEAGLVVPPEDPPALAEAIVRFYREDLAARLTEGVRRQKRAYTWDRLCEAVEGIIK